MVITKEYLLTQLQELRNQLHEVIKQELAIRGAEQMTLNMLKYLEDQEKETDSGEAKVQ